jgi:hypothetical protein
VLEAVPPDPVLRFSHPLLREAADGMLSGPAWRRLHRVIGGAVEDPDEAAWHLARGADDPNEALAGRAEQAAQNAAARGAAARAAALAKKAAGLTPDPDGRDAWRRRIYWLERLDAAGEFDQARRLGEKWVADVPVSLRGRLDEARPRTAAVIAQARAAGDPILLREALATDGTLAALAGEAGAGDRLREAVRLPGFTDTPFPYWAPEMALARWYLRRDEFDTAGELLNAVIAVSERHGSDESAEHARTNLMEVEWLAGNWDAAAAHAAAHARWSRETGHPAHGAAAYASAWSRRAAATSTTSASWPPRESSRPKPSRTGCTWLCAGGCSACSNCRPMTRRRRWYGWTRSRTCCRPAGSGNPADTRSPPT